MKSVLPLTRHRPHRRPEASPSREPRLWRGPVQQIELAAKPDVAEVVAGPLVSGRAGGRRRCRRRCRCRVRRPRCEEQRPRVAIDARHERPVAEELGSSAKADRERHREDRDVGEALAVVEVGPVEARRPLSCACSTSPVGTNQRPVLPETVVVAGRFSSDEAVWLTDGGGGGAAGWRRLAGLSPTR